MADSDIFDEFENDSQFNTIKNKNTKKNLMNEFDKVEDSFLNEEIDQSKQESVRNDSHKYQTEYQESQISEQKNPIDQELDLEENETIMSKSKKEKEDDFSDDFEDSIVSEKSAKKQKSKKPPIPKFSNKKSKFNQPQILLSSESKVKTYQELYEENQKLFNEMQGVNKKLTDMIDKKGYEKLLKQIKNNKKDFKNRPDEIKIKTYEKELENNQKIIKNLEIDLTNYELSQKRMDSTILLANMNNKIQKAENKIKILKYEVSNGEIENKKQALQLIKQVELKKKKISFKKIISEVESYMSKIEHVTDEILKLRTLQTDLIVEVQRGEKYEDKLKEEQNNMGIQEDNRVNQEKYKTLKKVISKWKNWIQVTEHNYEQKIEFLERDNQNLQKTIKDLYSKSEGLNKVLENQHKIFSEFINVENSMQKPISLKHMGMDKKVKVHKYSLKNKNSQLDKNSNSKQKKSEIIIKTKKQDTPIKQISNQKKQPQMSLLTDEVSQQKRKEELISQIEQNPNLEESMDSILRDRNLNQNQLQNEVKPKEIIEQQQKENLNDQIKKQRKNSDEDLEFILKKNESELKQIKVDGKDDFKDSDFDFLN